MKNLLNLSLIFSFLLIATSCGSTKTTIDNTKRDGSSYEKAIIVKSIEQEYEYIKEVCTNCQLLGQSLVKYKNKPYDIIEVKKPDGEVVKYYFDISKFFGKSFL